MICYFICKNAYHICRCEEIRLEIQQLTDGEYAVAKREVDKLRRELGMEESKTLQSQLEEKAYVETVFRGCRPLIHLQAAAKEGKQLARRAFTINLKPY